jgi:hypothetical protein
MAHFEQIHHVQVFSDGIPRRELASSLIGGMVNVHAGPPTAGRQVHSASTATLSLLTVPVFTSPTGICSMPRRRYSPSACGQVVRSRRCLIYAGCLQQAVTGAPRRQLCRRCSLWPCIFGLGNPVRVRVELHQTYPYARRSVHTPVLGGKRTSLERG